MKIKDKLHEECGIFGGFCKSANIAEYIKLGLFKLQHRGQESAGMSVGNYNQTLVKNTGLVLEVFNDVEIQNLSGQFGIGHVRYSTQGESDVKSAQPFLMEHRDGQISVAHNGNVTGINEIKEELKKGGIDFLSNSDSEILLRKILTLKELNFESIGESLNKHFSQGAYSIVFYINDKILAYRDSFGYRPLFFCEAVEGFFVASEDVAFSELDIIKIIEIQAGWGVEITSDNYEIKPFTNTINENKCVFEHIYFSHPDSNTFGKSVYQSRMDLGKLLAQNDYVEADIVVPVMESGYVSAIGYAKESKLSFEIGLLQNPWVGRSFIEPTQELREAKVKEKFSAIKSIVDGKRIILVDDSIVRGTTAAQTVKILRNAGAKEIHFRLASPMIINTCSWGVDIPSKEELAANNYKTEEDLAKYIDADSVKFLPLEVLKDYFGQENWCYNCLMVKEDLNLAPCGRGRFSTQAVCCEC